MFRLAFLGLGGEHDVYQQTYTYTLIDEHIIQTNY